MTHLILGDRDCVALCQGKKKYNSLINLLPVSANGYVVGFSAALYSGKRSSKSAGEINFPVCYALKKEQVTKPGSYLHSRKIYPEYHHSEAAFHSHNR